MNKAKIIELLLDGAIYNGVEGRLYHPSFRKGFRSIWKTNISLVAAENALSKCLEYSEQYRNFKIR